MLFIETGDHFHSLRHTTPTPGKAFFIMCEQITLVVASIHDVNCHVVAPLLFTVHPTRDSRKCAVRD